MVIKDAKDVMDTALTRIDGMCLHLSSPSALSDRSIGVWSRLGHDGYREGWWHLTKQMLIGEVLVVICLGKKEGELRARMMEKSRELARDN
jgi:hypothetical protein